ncbi:MAG TPA: M14 family metallopeptidase, partial [Candidatus Paceibacterota bacterium]|nr:M14 family metallopeptidase [Candidatus Paceibacterota bacterium]HQI26276.1 M14 family metallopeptidase [Candidatus Paceibacterota bacterium]
EGRDIMAYSYGEGGKEIAFVGGVHGGYSWNTVLAAREIKEYFEANQEKIPAGLKVTVIPLLNPDGLNKVVGTIGEFDAGDVPQGEETVPGRFNANNVDLNRNFDCNWQETSTWRNQKVNAGTKPFSEPEAQAFRNYINEAKPAAVVFYFSAAGGVFSSSCQDGILPETKELTSVYAKASGYPAYSEFDFYDISGDAVNWLAKEKIPGISVLLSNHQDTEWSKNRKGIEALLNYYAD